VSCLSSSSVAECENIGAWFVDNEASCYMTRTIAMFLSITNIDLNIHVDSGFCYPRYLGITRRSCLEAHMVLDMEYREQERLEHGPGGPIFLLLS
jgi:hypothetical protein